MKQATETLLGQHYFKSNELLYVNRSMESFMGPFHNHDFLEIAYIAEGEGFHHLGEQVQKVRKGHIFFIPIGVSHVFRPTSVGARELIVYNCIFSPRLLPKLHAFVSDASVAALIKDMEDGSLGFYEFQDRNDRFLALFESLYEQHGSALTGTTDYLHALLLELIIELGRTMDTGGAAAEAAGAARREAVFSDILYYLEQHCGQELTLGTIAAFSGFSERHLQRLFQRHTGQSWHSCLQAVRIRKSRELLRLTPHKIGVIAEMVGYKDVRSFNSVFKRATGVTPSEYRREMNRAAHL